MEEKQQWSSSIWGLNTAEKVKYNVGLVGFETSG